MSISPLPLRRPRLGLRALASYAPGMGDIVSFVRGTANATYRDSAGAMVTGVASSAPRDAHYENGVRTLLMEGGRTNSFTFTEGIDNAAWTKTECSALADQVASPSGGVTADALVETATAGVQHYLSRAVSFTANTPQPFSCFAKAGGRSRFQMYMNTGADIAGVSVDLAAGTVTSLVTGAGSLSYSRIEAWAGGWYRVCWAGTVNASATAAVLYVLMQDGTGATTYTGSAGIGFYLTALQFEANQRTCSSYVPATAGSTAARGTDRLALAFPAAPAESTFYARLVNVDYHVSQPSLNRIVASVGASAAARLWLYRSSGGAWALLHHNGTASVSVSASGTPAYGDVVEMRGILYGDGSVQLGVSINAAAEVVSARSAALTPAAAWGGAARLWLGSDDGGASTGVLALARLLVPPGVQSLATLRGRSA